MQKTSSKDIQNIAVNILSGFDDLNDPSTAPEIVILTGAGISAESGLQTFRGDGGLWCGHRVEDVATPEAFASNPDLVHDFYNQRREGLLDPAVQPNPAHKALAHLQKEWVGRVSIVTQNIDDLHERGGADNVIHMHGEALRIFCVHCHEKFDRRDALTTADICENCGTKGGLRPDIVWFGEMPYHMDDIERRLQSCDIFLSIGTSGNVYPAAGFVNLANYTGAQTVEINLVPSLNASTFNHGIYNTASIALPQFIDHILELKK
jgi:NAD-dependent deacetylase